jgi:two-component system, OmpR family, phosphate regulon sensor histidine kinase PhoR
VSRLTLRIVIVLAGLSIAGITFTQIYWVRKAFDLHENQFYRDVDAALRHVATTIFEINKTPSPANNPVNQVSTNYFVVTINGPIDANLLEFLLATEFEKRNIKAEFEYGVYDCIYKCMADGKEASGSNNKRLVSETSLPISQAAPMDGYYFGVQFPRLEVNLIGQMGIWVFSSAVNLVVIFFFVYTLFVILKQRRLSEIQRDFINNMTHEFKTPISTIAISAEVLKDPRIIHTPERLLNYTTIIQNENNRLKQQVERVLQMARLDKEEIGLKKELLDVHEIIREAVRNISIGKTTDAGNIELNLESSHPYMQADKLHLTNVFFNLLDNAIKYCKETPRIIISTAYINEHLHITVKDNGIGISADNHKKVFQKFFRVSTGNIHDVKGFGIGLNYVKLVVESHKGKINLTSELGKGSTFTLIFPVA